MADHRPLVLMVDPKPPWYKDMYTTTQCPNDMMEFSYGKCANPTTVFDKMVRRIRRLATKNQHRMPLEDVDAIYRDIRHEIIQTRDLSMSVTLVKALLDIVELSLWGGFESILDVDDGAGLKQCILSQTNYTMYYTVPDIMNKCYPGCIVIPVAIHDPTNVYMAAMERSMLGTYKVGLGAAEDGNIFLQQVLVVPSDRSLDTLSKVLGSRFHLWNMTLEMPCNAAAACPMLIPMSTNDVPRPSTPKCVSASSSKDLQPPAQRPCSGEVATEQQESSGGESNSTNRLAGRKLFCCAGDDNQGPQRAIKTHCMRRDEHCFDLSYCTSTEPLVYCRTASRELGENKAMMIAVVANRPEGELYCSSSGLFLRCIKRTYLKGSNALLRSRERCYIMLQRASFLVWPEVHQEIIAARLTTLVKRVTPPAMIARLYPPNTVLRSLHPSMSKVVQLGVRMMDAKIPCALQIAELLLLSDEATAKAYTTAIEQLNSHGG